MVVLQHYIVLSLEQFSYSSAWVSWFAERYAPTPKMGVSVAFSEGGVVLLPIAQ